MNEFGFWLGIAAQPVFIGQTVAVVVFAVNVIFVQPVVTVLVHRIHRPVVDIVVLTGITHAGEQRTRGAQRRSPFVLVISVQVHTVAALVNFLVEVGNGRDAGHGVVAEVLSPPAGGAGFPCWSRAVHFTVVDVAVHIEHRYDVNFTRINEVGDPLF